MRSTVEWDDARPTSAARREIMAEYKELAADAGHVAHARTATPTQALAGAAKKLEAAFEFPYLAHAPMEPLNCVVQLDATSCEIWTGEQFQTVDQCDVAARAAASSPSR